MNTEINKHAKRVVQRFSTWSDFVETAESSKSCIDPHQASVQSEASHGRPGFFGGASFDAGVSLGLYGWAEGARAVKELGERLSEVVGSKVLRPSWTHAVEGVALDVAALAEGVPECMLMPVDQIEFGTGRVLHVVVNLAHVGMTEGDQIIHRGAAILALVDAFEHLGYSCEIDLHRYCQTGRRQVGRAWGHSMIVPLKAPGEALDLDRLAFALVHPASNRRLAWGIIDGEEDADIYTRTGKDGGYGRPDDPPKGEQGDLYVPATGNCVDYNCFRDEADAIRYVEDMLRSHGVELGTGE